MSGRTVRVILLMLICLNPHIHSESATAESTKDPYDLAAKMYSDGQYEKALIAGKEALADAREIFGADSREIMKPLHLVANAQEKLGQYQAAALSLERLREIQEDMLGEKHSEVSKTITSLIGLYQKLNNQKMVAQLNALAASRWGASSSAPSNKAAATSKSYTAQSQTGDAKSLIHYINNNYTKTLLRLSRSLPASQSLENIKSYKGLKVNNALPSSAARVTTFPSGDVVLIRGAMRVFDMGMEYCVVSIIHEDKWFGGHVFQNEYYALCEDLG
jgi:hypothetical protein